MWFGKVQMSVQRVNTHRGRSSSSGFKPCPAAWTLGAVPAWGHSGSHLRELLGTLKDSRDFFFCHSLSHFWLHFRGETELGVVTRGWEMGTECTWSWWHIGIEVIGAL